LDWQIFVEGIFAMTTDEVLDALGRYTKDFKESDRQTATQLGIRRSVLWDWLYGRFSLRNARWPG
jgi:hypothetical protein